MQRNPSNWTVQSHAHYPFDLTTAVHACQVHTQSQQLYMLAAHKSNSRMDVKQHKGVVENVDAQATGQDEVHGVPWVL